MKKIITFIKMNYKIILMILITSIVVIGTGVYILIKNGVIDFNSIKINEQDSLESKNENTNINNNNNNNVVENVIKMSDISYTGATYNITKDEFIENLKKELISVYQGKIYITQEITDSILPDSVAYTYFFRDTTLSSNANIISLITVEVENDTNNIIEISLSGKEFNQTLLEKLAISIKCLFNNNNYYIEKVANNIEKLRQQILNDGQSIYYNDNMLYQFASGENSSNIMVFISACTESEYNYLMQNKNWRKVLESKNTTNINSEEKNSNYYEHPQEWYEEQEKLYENTSSNTSSSSNLNSNTSNTKSNKDYKTIDDVLNDTKYFSKYSLNLVNNAKTLTGAKNHEELQMKENWSDLKPYAFYYDGNTLNDTAIYTSRDTVVKDETHPVYNAKFVYDYKGYCYVRKGVDLSKIKIEYDIEYKAKQKNSDTYDDFGFVFTPKLKVDGNKLTIELNANCITDRFYG